MKINVSTNSSKKRRKPAYIATVGDQTRVLYPHPKQKGLFLFLRIQGNNVQADAIDTIEYEYQLKNYKYRPLEEGDTVTVTMEF